MANKTEMVRLTSTEKILIDFFRNPYSLWIILDIVNLKIKESLNLKTQFPGESVIERIANKNMDVLTPLHEVLIKIQSEL